MGSSFHALHPLAIRLAEHGIRVTMVETSELIYFWPKLLSRNTLLVVVSQSGRSAELLRLLDLNAGLSPLIGVTNDACSPLARAADAVVLIDAGPEASVSCKTYVSSLMALAQMGDVLCGNGKGTQRGLEEAADLAEEYLVRWHEHVDEALEILRDTRHIILAGRGESLASTGTGGLILKEAARFPAEGMSSAAFRHGPLEMLSSEMFLLVFEGGERSAALNRRLAKDVHEFGGKALLVSPSNPVGLFHIPPVIDPVRPILEILPVQMLSLALAARDGLEAGAFARAAKVTAVE
jgi:glucosamine--fructose-6-phosphate aminotransferase (isomerizing)